MTVAEWIHLIESSTKFNMFSLKKTEIIKKRQALIASIPPLKSHTQSVQKNNTPSSIYTIKLFFFV
jgi:hypothetical protein